MILNQTTTLLSVLSDPTRLRLLNALGIGTLSVSEVTSALAMSQPRISHHLAVLLRAGLVTVRRDGARAYYSIETEGSHAEFAATVLHLLSDDAQLLSDKTRVVGQIRGRKALRRAFFADLAEVWPDRLGKWIDLEGYRSLLLRLLPKGLSTADLGCGSGWLLPDLSAAVKTIIGVDHSPEIITLAKQNAIKHGIENCEFRLGELEHLPLLDGEVELVLLGLVLQHVVDPPASLKEAARICAPGGRLLVIEPLSHTEEEARKDLGELWMGFHEDEVISWVRSLGFVPNTVERFPSRAGRLALLAVLASEA